MPRMHSAKATFAFGATFSFENCGFWVSPAAIPGWERAGYYHPESHFAMGVGLGPLSASVSCAYTVYQGLVEEDGTIWTYLSGPQVPGFPDCLPDLDPATAGVVDAKVRSLWVTVSGPGASDSVCITQGNGANYFIVTIDGLIQFYRYGNTGFASKSIACSLSMGPVPVDKQVAPADLGDGMAYPVHPDQLQGQDPWNGDYAWSVTCGGASVSGTGTYASSYDAPAWSGSMAYGAGYDCGGGIPGVWMSDAQTLALSTTGQYPGLRASGTEQDAPGCYYVFSGSQMKGQVVGSEVPEFADPDAYGHAEWGHILSAYSLALRAFDIRTPMSDLVAHATYWQNTDVVWDAEEQTYEHGPNWGQYADLAVPGTHSKSWCATSRRPDLVPNGPIHVTLTDQSLKALGLPTADNKMHFHGRALDALTMDPADWGAHDQHGGHYHGLLKVGIQSPLSVQWAQDDREAPGPPSWWETETGTPVLRENQLEAVVVQDGSASATIRRTLRYYEPRTDVTRLTAPVGTPNADVWLYGFDWQKTYQSSKHLLAGTEVCGPVPIKDGLVCESSDPDIDEWYTAVMPWSEDVWNWFAYRWLRLIVSCAHASAWVLGVTLAENVQNTTDPHIMNSEERIAGCSTAWTDGEVRYSVAVPASADHAVLDVDLITAGAPLLWRVATITLSGIPGTPSGADPVEFRLHEVQLIPPEDRVRLIHTCARRMRYGGYMATACGTGENLGMVRLPEEASGRWWIGGHRICELPESGGATTGIPPYGLPFWTRAIPTCGRSQDSLKPFGAWGEMHDTWGQEGIYGRRHTDPADGAMEPWVDEFDAVLGPNRISDVPELFWDALEAADFLTPARDADGPTDLPVCLRCGSWRLGEGMQWAAEDETLVLALKKHFYGMRVGVAVTQTGGVCRRAPAGLSFVLYEQPQGGSARQVGEATTDADGRLFWSRGVNEFRHLESGSDAETNPDWTERTDYLSDVLAPGEDETALEFGAHHYQVLPSWVLALLPRGARRVSMTRQRGDGVVWLVWDQLEPTEAILGRRSPNGGLGWLPVAEIAEGTCPAVSRGSDATVLLSYLRDGALLCRTWDESGWGEESTVLTGSCTAQDHDVETFAGTRPFAVVADVGGTRVLQYVRVRMVGGVPRAEEGSITTIASGIDDCVPSIRRADDTTLTCGYLRDGEVRVSRSADDGRTWTEVA